MIYKVKDWEKFQHYKNRRPPWIRLYRDILDDPEFFALSGDDFKILIMLWLIASEDAKMRGILPDSKTLAFRLRTSSKKIEQSIKALNHWIIPVASNQLAHCKQDAIPETETETEGDQIRGEEIRSEVSGAGVAKKKKKSSKYPPGFGVNVWEAYSSGYKERYGTMPIRNGKQNTYCCQLRERLGDSDSIHVAHYYPSTRNSYHVARGHSLGCLLADAEKIWTEWKTGKQITASKAREEDRLQTEGDDWNDVIQEVCHDG